MDEQVPNTKVMFYGLYTSDYEPLQKVINTYEKQNYTLSDIKVINTEVSNRTYVELLLVFKQM